MKTELDYLAEARNEDALEQTRLQDARARNRATQARVADEERERQAGMRQKLGLPAHASPQDVNRAFEQRRADLEKLIHTHGRYRRDRSVLLADSDTWKAGRPLDADHVRGHLGDVSDERVAEVLALRKQAELDFDQGARA